MARDYVFFNFPVAMFQIVWKAPNLQYGVYRFLDCVTNYCLGERIAIENETLQEACNYFNIEWKYTAQNAKMCKDCYDEYKRYNILTGIEKSSLFEVRDNIKTYKDRYLIGLIAFLAVKSMIGRKKWIWTNYALVFHRMAGALGGELPQVLQSYKRRKRERLMQNELAAHNVTYYPMRRGFCLSTKLTVEDLAVEVEMHGKPSMAAKRAQRKAKQAEAVAKAKQRAEMAQIMGEPPLYNPRLF